MSARSWHGFGWGLLIAALVVAGGVSLLASSDPDGLESVAERLGFDHAAHESTAGFGGYAIPGVEGLAGDALAGVVGVLVVLLVMTLLARLVRRGSSVRG